MVYQILLKFVSEKNSFLTHSYMTGTYFLFFTDFFCQQSQNLIKIGKNKNSKIDKKKILFFIKTYYKLSKM